MAAKGLVLRKNDRVVFYGDSITEAQLYTNYVETYLAGRFPELNLSFFNAGWGGDRAPGALARLERDVLALKPTIVTLCFGMNDGEYTRPNDRIRTAYVEAMTKLVARLKALKIRVVILTPGYAEEALNPNLAAVKYNSRGLRILADEALKLARKVNAPSYDLHKLMTEVDRKAKAFNPKLSLTAEGVHPLPTGHLVMAYGLLQALGVPPHRREISFNLKTGRISFTEGIRISNCRRQGTILDMRMELDRLPFFVDPRAREILPFVPFQETYNSLRVSVTGLETEYGSLRTGSMRSPLFTADDLAHGINIFSVWAVHPVQAAQRLHSFTQEKDLIYFKAWRILGLCSGGGAEYHPEAHMAGMRACLSFEKARRRMALGTERGFRFELLEGEGAGQIVDNDEFISQWSLRGPFPSPYRQSHIGDEASFTAGIPALGTQWTGYDLNTANPSQALIEAFGPVFECSAYAVTFIDSPADQTATLKIGSDDGVAAWLNGRCVMDKLTDMRPLATDQDRARVKLRKGKNVLLLKISQGSGEWGFCARFEGLRSPVVCGRTPNTKPPAPSCACGCK